ncbi:MAG: succinate dehydrogenase, cytochrome b556 subunit [Gammaproteobacteria bacterium]|nr:succinate dehydrogenase, cytochrome b556 subunit [Gammaproteobacteria bacterium]
MYKARIRPKNLDLLSVKFPMAAIMSVGHRAAGIVLFLSLPYFLYLLQLSLTNETGFALARAELQGPLVRLVCLLLIWALAHHFIAGIRYFLLDLDICIDRKMAQKSAVIVMVSGFLVFAFFSLLLF